MITRNIKLVIFLNFLLFNVLFSYNPRNGISNPLRNIIGFQKLNSYYPSNVFDLTRKNVSVEILEKTEQKELQNFLSNIDENTIENKKAIIQSFIKDTLISSPNNSSAFSAKKEYKENFFKVKVDHFSLENFATFDLRYLINDKYSSFKLNSTNNTNSDNFPIFFYCGNEGDIENFYVNTGFITETLAKEFNALIIYGEHRFYGKSLPFGVKQDYDIQKNKVLTASQALSDFVDLLTNFKKRIN